MMGTVERNVAVVFIIISGLTGSLTPTTPKYQSFVLEEEVTNPLFISKPGNYQTQLGGRVTLVCEIDNIGTSTVIWKKDNRIITAGNIVIRKDKRFSLDRFNLSLKGVALRDAGEYVCEVETYSSKPIRQISHLQVLVPPVVQPHPQDGSYVVRKGSTITLECRSRGNPPPLISWSRKNGEPSYGDKSLTGDSILIQEVTRHHAGVYLCQADNGVGEPAIAEIHLNVLFPPEIMVEQNLNAGGEGVRAEIVCTVHAEPRPDIRWYKDTMLLDPSEFRSMESYGNKHILIINSVSVTDFGNYSCMADNTIGRNRGNIELSGRPHSAMITSTRRSYLSTEYTLTWKTVSLLDLQEYRILYRLNREVVAGKSPEWTNIIPTTVGERIQKEREKSLMFTGEFTLYGLLPDSEYEVIIQARNSEGWSPPSRVFTFSTPSHDYEPYETRNESADFRTSSGNKMSRDLLGLTLLCLALHWCSQL